MEHEDCGVPGCRERVEVRFSRPGREQAVEDRWYCATHATEVLDGTARELGARRAVGGTTDRCAVEIELVVCDAREGFPCQVILNEINGVRRLSFPTGRFEAWMLAWELRREEPANLGTHRAMVVAIRALGGAVESVTINDMPQPDICIAEVCMSQGDTPVVVGMRPSDALILATICAVPIYVEAAVWAKDS